MKQDYKKIKIAIKYWMLGRDYHIALKAMEFASKYHTGLRKDGVTPEFQHQVSQANFARTLNIIDMENTLATIFLHDVVEDYDVTIDTIEKEFGHIIARSVFCMTNCCGNGKLKPTDIYFNDMIQDPIASIAKGCDRIHNVASMKVYTKEKMLSKVDETREFVIPMLKKASRTHTLQESAYQNIRHNLEVQMQLIEILCK